MIPLRLQYYTHSLHYVCIVCICYIVVKEIRPKTDACYAPQCAKRTHELTIDCDVWETIRKRNCSLCLCMRHLTQPLHSLSFHSSFFFDFELATALFGYELSHCWRVHARLLMICTTPYKHHTHTTQRTCFCWKPTLFCCLLLISTISLNRSLE